MSDKNNITLKPGWRRVKFGDVVRQCKEKADPETSGLERYVAGDHMDTDDLRISRWGEIGSGYLGPAFHMRFKPGQVLYGSRRTYLRKVAVPDFEGICANTTFVLEPHDPQTLLAEFLPFLMQTDAFNAYSVKNSKGSVNPYINFSDLAKFEFALPPLDQQAHLLEALHAFENSIVETESLLSATNAATQSLLAAWWEASCSALRPLGDLSLISGAYGINASAKTLVPGEPRYIRITDIDSDGRLLSSDAVGVDSQNLDGYLLEENDLLIARTGNTVGKSYLYSKELGQAVYAGYLVKFRIDPTKALPKYIFLMTRAPQYRDWIKSSARVGAQPNINAREYSSLKIPTPNLEKQQYLVEKVEGLEVARERCINRIEALRDIKALFVQDEVIDVI